MVIPQIPHQVLQCLSPRKKIESADILLMKVFQPGNKGKFFIFRKKTNKQTKTTSITATGTQIFSNLFLPLSLDCSTLVLAADTKDFPQSDTVPRYTCLVTQLIQIFFLFCIPHNLQFLNVFIETICLLLQHFLKLTSTLSLDTHTYWSLWQWIWEGSVWSGHRHGHGHGHWHCSIRSTNRGCEPAPSSSSRTTFLHIICKSNINKVCLHPSRSFCLRNKHKHLIQVHSHAP